VAPRVSPGERVRAAIDALYHSDKDLASVLEAVGRLTGRLLMQQAFEAEVDAFLGWRRYEPRTEDCPAGPAMSVIGADERGRDRVQAP